MDAEDILKDLEKQGRKKVTEKDFLIAIVLISSIVVLFFIYVNFIPKPLFKNNISVEIIEITGDCNECFEIISLTDSLINANENLNIKSRIELDYNTEEAKELIDKYKISKVPALIIKSKKLDKIKEIDNKIFLIKDNYAVFDKAVPYIDLSSNQIKGLVNLKEVHTNCEDCMPLSQIQQQFEKWGVKINNYEVVPDSSEKGQNLIKNNNLTFLPSLLISKNIEEYWWVFEQIKNSFIEKQDYYLFKTPLSPYKDITTREIKGLVDITYLKNKSCGDCFNVTDLKDSFQSLGVFINNEKAIDISSIEGKNLLKKYNITAIPTVILSKEIQDYESVKNILEQAGTFEKDDNFIFRRLDRLNVEYQEI